MVRAYFPQNSVQSIISNTDYPSQGGLLDVPLLLDVFPGSAAAYSLRKLSRKYTGPAIKVRRTSDSDTKDIGFTSQGDLDDDALTAFVGGSDGEIIIMYDQSGNDINLDDLGGEPSFQPRIIIAGVLQISGRHSAITFTQDDILLSTNSLPTPVSHLFIFSMLNSTNLSNLPINFNLDSPNEGSREVSARMFNNGGAVEWNAGNTTTNQQISSGDLGDLLQHVLTLTKTAGTDNQKIRLDETEIGARTQASGSSQLEKIAIGNTKDNGPAGAEMQFQELIFYTDNQLANLENIDRNIISYWKLSQITTELDEPITTELGELILAE